jgi:hypothetical protein
MFAQALRTVLPDRAALDLWRGKDANIGVAQHALIHRARCNHAALRGAFDAGAERDFGYRKAS